MARHEGMHFVHVRIQFKREASPMRLSLIDSLILVRNRWAAAETEGAL